MSGSEIARILLLTPPPSSSSSSTPSGSNDPTWTDHIELSGSIGRCWAASMSPWPSAGMSSGNLTGLYWGVERGESAICVSVSVCLCVCVCVCAAQLLARRVERREWRRGGSTESLVMEETGGRGRGGNGESRVWRFGFNSQNPQPLNPSDHACGERGRLSRRVPTCLREFHLPECVSKPVLRLCSSPCSPSFTCPSPVAAIINTSFLSSKQV